MIDPTQLITEDIVQETRAIYEKANKYNLTGINFLGDAVVIYGAAKILKPKIICEIGTASGLSSVLLLEGALRGGESPTLYSYDTLDKLYYDHTKNVGFFLHEVAPQLENYFHLHSGIGSYATAFMEDCKSNLNLAYIDASHSSPWAALDLLALLPVTEKGAYFMLDATDIPVGYMQGPYYLYHYWKNYKFIAPYFTPPHSPTLTGFLEYDGDAEKAVDSAISAIGADWQMDVPDEYIKKITDSVGNLVGEAYRWKLLDLMNERAKQYRCYVDLHKHFEKKHLNWVAEVSTASNQWASIQNIISWKAIQKTRRVINRIMPQGTLRRSFFNKLISLMSG